MPRPRRVSPDGSVQHVLNRGNRKAAIFHQDSDYEHFTNLLADAFDRIPMRLLAFCLMPNHWHLVLWVVKGDELSAYMQWLCTSHVHHHHHVYGTTGHGHVYQGRYRNFLIQHETHLYRVLRYVEANAKTANLVRRAEEWRWSSLRRRHSADGRALLSEWPVTVPENWPEFVNNGIPSDELRRLRESARRGAPYGSDRWVKLTAAEYALESTLAITGRPLKTEEARPATSSVFE